MSLGNDREWVRLSHLAQELWLLLREHPGLQSLGGVGLADRIWEMAGEYRPNSMQPRSDSEPRRSHQAAQAAQEHDDRVQRLREAQKPPERPQGAQVDERMQYPGSSPFALAQEPQVDIEAVQKIVEHLAPGPELERQEPQVTGSEEELVQMLMEMGMSKAQARKRTKWALHEQHAKTVEEAIRLAFSLDAELEEALS